MRIQILNERGCPKGSAKPRCLNVAGDPPSHGKRWDARSLFSGATRGWDCLEPRSRDSPCLRSEDTWYNAHNASAWGRDCSAWRGCRSPSHRTAGSARGLGRRVRNRQGNPRNGRNVPRETKYLPLALWIRDLYPPRAVCANRAQNHADNTASILFQRLFFDSPLRQSAFAFADALFLSSC